MENSMHASVIHHPSRHESKQHGSSRFPYIVYHGVIPHFLHGYPLHWHDEMEIIYITDGSCTITIEHAIYQACAGDIFPVLPDMLHSIEKSGSAECTYFNFVFNLHLLESGSSGDLCFSRYLQPYLDGRSSLPHRIPANSPAGCALRPHLDLLAEKRREQNNETQLLIKGRLFEIFWILSDLRITGTGNGENNIHSIQSKKMKELLQFLHSNFTRQVTVQEAADFCGYSTSYFMRFFKSFTGSTFITYLNTCRLQKAEELLLTSQYSVLEISGMSGFENHSYFIRLFKRCYGITPCQYRLMHA